MKYLILFSFIGIFITECSTPKTGLDFDSVHLVLNQYPIKTKKVYSMNRDFLHVKLTNKGAGLDSMIWKGKVDFIEDRGNFLLASNFEKEHYKNKCIEDGMVIRLDYEKSDSIFRSIQFSNVYHLQLDSIISFINQQLDSTNQIRYNKKYLIDLENSCD